MISCSYFIQEYAELWDNGECEAAYGDIGWVTDRMICAGIFLTSLPTTDPASLVSVTSPDTDPQGST